MKVTCPKAATACPKARITVTGAKRKNRGVLARFSGVTLRPGKSRLVGTGLTKRGRQVLTQHRSNRLNVKVTVKPNGLKGKTARRTARIQGR